MGNSCSQRKINTSYGELQKVTQKKIGELMSEAIRQHWQFMLIIDDYTSIQSKRRPKTGQLCHP